VVEGLLSHPARNFTGRYQAICGWIIASFKAPKQVRIHNAIVLRGWRVKPFNRFLESCLLGCL
jgi:hypothetical protein